jgi:hypothetical protein
MKFVLCCDTFPRSCSVRSHDECHIWKKILNVIFGFQLNISYFFYGCTLLIVVIWRNVSIGRLYTVCAYPNFSNCYSTSFI